MRGRAWRYRGEEAGRHECAPEGAGERRLGDTRARLCSSYPIWEDFISKAVKLQSQLRTTVVAVAAFLDAFQKVADLATSTRGEQMEEMQRCLRERGRS
ncbi:Metastasis suppressor protein 1 [Triplophysa tibetana]|uniref:Metastasis suppressor protein 1 n=1 Tax=Triplophysa tibetana TaxID=1572043 RepID=A0A5A9MYX7_9TELE|nr:Metastasis suppressor protein 1 [Triplophysa tibetana]